MDVTEKREDGDVPSFPEKQTEIISCPEEERRVKGELFSLLWDHKTSIFVASVIFST